VLEGDPFVHGLFSISEHASTVTGFSRSVRESLVVAPNGIMTNDAAEFASCLKYAHLATRPPRKESKGKAAPLIQQTADRTFCLASKTGPACTPNLQTLLLNLLDRHSY